MLTREMKDSGVEWIGEIPKHWKVVPSNLFFYNSSEKVNGEIDEEIKQLTASQKYGVISQKRYMELEAQMPVQKQNLTDLKLVDKNDFVISLRSFEGGIEIAQESGGITLAYTVIKEKTNKTRSQYYKYLFKSNMYIQALRSTVLDTIRDGKSIKYSHFSMVPVVLPPIKEQEKIAERIDKLSNNINNIINDTRLSIEEFKKYKQSIITEVVTKGLNPNVKMKSVNGIEIEHHPEHWTLSKIKYHAKIDPPKQEHFSDLPTEATFLPMKKLKNGFIINTEKDKTEELENKYTYFAEGDIVIAKVRPSFENGNIAIANNLLNKTGFGTSEIFVLRNKRKQINQEFLFYFLRNDIFIQYGSASMTGVAGLQRISSNFIMNYPIAIPPLEEQLEIVNYLNDKIKQIDKLIIKKERVIEELEKYQKSLIYEYVTGKKEV